MLLIDQEAALEAIPDLLPADEGRQAEWARCSPQVLSASGEIAGEAAERLREIAQLFGVEGNLTIAASAVRRQKPRAGRRPPSEVSVRACRAATGAAGSKR